MNGEVLSEDDKLDNTSSKKLFGLCLKEARETANLTVDEISDAIKLPEDMILALENSAIDILPPVTFTQGYIRNYARFLKLPENEVVELYNHMLPTSDAPLSPRSFLPRQLSSSELVFKIASYFVVLCIVAMFIFWFLQADTEIEGNQEDDVAASVDGSNNKQFYEKIINAEENLEAVEKNSQQTILDNSADETAPEAGSEPELEADLDEVIIIESSDVSDIIPEDLDVEVDEIGLVSKIKKNVTDDVSEYIAQEGDDVLILGTISESWIEISDANNQRLVFELIKKGGYYRVTGKAPFKIFLGNAPTVSLQLNDEAIDVRQFIRSDKLAHIELYGNGRISVLKRE